MNDTIFFADDEQMVVGLSLLADPNAWLLPVQTVQLSGQPDQTGWLLSAESHLTGVVGERGIEHRGPEVVVSGQTWQVGQTREWPTLAQAVPLRETASGGPLCYVLVDSGPALADLVRSCLLLDNDHLAVLALADGQSLVRVREPNAFLLEAWRRSVVVSIYWPADQQPRLLVADGHAHPLAGRLRLPAGQDLILVSAAGVWHRAVGNWRDIYDHLTIDVAALQMQALRPAAQLPRVEVSLTLRPADTDDQPNLWLLDPNHRAVLAAVVAEAAEQELASVQVAALRPARSGDPAYVLVEPPGAPARLPLPLQGVPAFVSRLSSEHLFIPLGYRLSPLLSRRGLVDTLQLSEGFLTVIRHGSGEALEVLRIPRSALRPLADLVDYEVAGSATAVANWLDEFSLDLNSGGAERREASPVASSWWRRLWPWAR